MILYLSDMKRYRQFLPVIIADFVVDRWHHPVHNHNHYELIYIKKGLGSHYINKEVIDYRSGNVFLLGPDEEHYFEVNKATHFIFLKFTDLFLPGKGNDEYYGHQQLEYLIKNREVRTSKFNLNANDQQTVMQLFNVIISLNTDKARNEELIRLQILALAAILKRNLPEITSSAGQTKEMEAVFSYIHENIYEPEKLKSPVMADFFHTTANYIGPYFKRNAGITLRDYIRDYRKSLLRKRMESGKYSLKDLAAEFSLTDASHVSKLLK
jgi:AraC family L-rhamnose operon regulatory protein RhaS